MFGEPLSNTGEPGKWKTAIKTFVHVSQVSAGFDKFTAYHINLIGENVVNLC